MSATAERLVVIAADEVDRLTQENARLTKLNKQLTFRLTALEGGLMRLSEIVHALKLASPENSKIIQQFAPTINQRDA